MLLQPAHVGLACWRASVVLAVEQFAQGLLTGGRNATDTALKEVQGAQTHRK